MWILYTSQYNVGIRAGSSPIWFSEGNHWLTCLCNFFISLRDQSAGQWGSWVDGYTGIATGGLWDSIDFYGFFKVRHRFICPIQKTTKKGEVSAKDGIKKNKKKM